MSTNNLHIKILLLVAVLSKFCTLAAQAQTGFREPTVNTILPRFAMKSLASGEPTDTLTGWRLGGEGELMFRKDSACFFLEDTWLVSPTIEASRYNKLELRMTLDAIAGSPVSRQNYPVVIEYDDGQQQDFNVVIDSKNLTIPLTLDRNGNFRIKILSDYTEDKKTGIVLISDIALHGIHKYLPITPEIDNTRVTFPIADGMNEWCFDYFTMDFLKAERNNSNIDTLYFSNFTAGEINEAVSTPENEKSGNFYYAKNRGRVSLSVPMFANGINDSVYVDFKTFKTTQNDTATIKVFYNEELLTTIIRTSEMPIQEWSDNHLSFVPSSSFGTLKFVCENLLDTTKYVYLSLDDLLITQKSMYSYRSIEGFPRQESGDLTVSGLNCNEDYRVLLQFVDEANAYGEEVVSDVLDISVKTTGEHKAMQAGEVLELDGDFEGSVIMDGSCQITGTGRVMGELCYAFTYRTDEWEAVGLPFEPRLLGAFIGGEPYYLRENVDYHLQSYAADGKGGYAFRKMGRLEGFKGYLVKVPSTLTQYDGNTIYIYSEKGIEINAPRTYTYTETFTHLANPCAYALDDPWTVFGAGMIYRYDGEAFRLCTTDDTVKPFESIIVYNGGANTAPRVIRIDGGSSVPNGTDHEVLLATGEGCFALHGYEGRVTVTSLGGMTVHDGWLDDGEAVNLPAGAYLVTYGGRTTKVIL